MRIRNSHMLDWPVWVRQVGKGSEREEREWGKEEGGDAIWFLRSTCQWECGSQWHERKELHGPALKRLKLLLGAFHWCRGRSTDDSNANTRHVNPTAGTKTAPNNAVNWLTERYTTYDATLPQTPAPDTNNVAPGRYPEVAVARHGDLPAMRTTAAPDTAAAAATLPGTTDTTEATNDRQGVCQVRTQVHG